jgi:hypothetical protein
MKEKPGEIGRILGEIRDALSVTWSELGSILEVDGKDLEGVARGQVKASGEIKRAAQVLVERVVALRRVGEELQTVAQFVDAVASEIQRLSFSFQNVVANRRAFQHVPDHNQQSIDDYRVLRQEAYGRYIRTRDVDSGKEEEFRVGWGAVGWPKQRIYSRNAPVIRALMSARKDQCVTVRMPQERELEILEVSLLERHKDELKNFALMEFALDRRGTPEKLIRDLARWQEAERMDLRGGTLETLTEVPVPSVPEPLTIDSRAGLNDRFFMDPLEAQEAVMAFPSVGHVLVEGVAGSGKTSVALGRAAMLCMERPDEGMALEFTPESGVGFVLSEQLVSYLQDLRAGRLNLDKMPVKSLFRLRQETLQVRRVLRGGVRRLNADADVDDPCVGSAAWFGAVGEMMPNLLRSALARFLPAKPAQVAGKTSPHVTARHWEALAPKWEEFVKNVPKAFEVGRRDRLEGCVQRLDLVRGTLADALEVLPPWNSPRFRDDRRRVSQGIREAFIQAFDFAGRYFEAVSSPEFAGLLENHLGSAGGPRPSTISSSISAAKGRAAGRQLANADIDCILLIAHQATLGYRGRDGALPIEGLRETEYRSQVFIDEVQDFSEVQVRLMAAQADPKSNAVTAVGDFAQKVGRGGLEAVSRSGLELSEDRTVFLGWNKRQTSPLHELSLAFRMGLSGDKRPCHGEPARPGDEKAYNFSVGTATATDLCEELISTREQHPDYSMAVLCPPGPRAAELEKAVHASLWERNIPARVSDRVDAARIGDSFYVHFTTAAQAKGLEFAAVFVVDLDDYDLTDETKVAALYVALSRPRRRLGLSWRNPPNAKLMQIIQPHLGPRPGAAGAASLSAWTGQREGA